MVSVPFLLSSWAIGTALGAVQIYQGKDATDTLWMLAGVAFAFYTGSKGIGVMERGVGSRGWGSSEESEYRSQGRSRSQHYGDVPSGDYGGGYGEEEGDYGDGGYGYEASAPERPRMRSKKAPRAPSAATHSAPAWDGSSPPAQGPMIGD